MEASNVKVMREALEIAKKAICHHARTKHTCDSLAWESSTIQANCGDILCGHRDLCEAKTAIQKALSEPPRNCENYDNKTDAETGFVEETGEDDSSQHYWQMFANWLFAPATERKGEEASCVGEDAECNGPDCGYAENCPYYLESMKEDSSLRDELERRKQTKKGDDDGR